MSKLTFYTNPMSRGRVARWMLEETGIPYETVLLEYGTTMKAPEYLAINPMGKVPAIKHGDTVVTENLAIALYLADLVPEKKLAPAVGSPERGSYYRWMAMMGPLEQAMIGKANKVNVDPMQAGYGKIDDVTNVLDQAIGDRNFIVGDHFTMADLLVSAYIAWYLQFKLIDPKPSLVRYSEYHRKNRPAAQKADDIDNALLEKEKAKQQK